MAGILTIQDAIQDHRRRCAAEARRLFRDAVRPVFRRIPDGRPELFGSCVLLEIDGALCVATAAHVLDEHETASIHIGGREEFLPLNLTFQATTKPYGRRSADSIDIAVAKLSSNEVEKLGDVRFIGFEDQVFDVPSGPNFSFLTCGYRASQNKPPRPKNPMPPLRLWTYNGQGADVPNPHQRLAGGSENFAVNYPKRVQRLNGNPEKATRPSGVSGGAIFLLGDLADPKQLGSNEPHRPKLAGIAIEHIDQEKVLIGSKLRAVRNAFAQHPG